MSELAKLLNPQHELCEAAVRWVLQRIGEHPATFYLLGDGTESYAKLVKAFAAVTGRTEEDVVESYRPHEKLWAQFMEKREADERLLRYCRENNITAKD